MKVFPRTQLGNPILRAKTKKVPLVFVKTPKFKTLVKRMIYTMRRADGVGLAAPQIGQPLAIAVIEMQETPTRPDLKPQEPIVIVNPRITRYSTKRTSGYEGCLSFRGVRGSVPRSESITVEYHDERGKKIVEKASGFWARIFQHEIDHLNGVVYVDRVEDTKTFMTIDEFVKRVVNKKKKR
jgi:peptide deformylase